jgi:hypothetical protein
MTAPPEANTEYSRGSGPSSGLHLRRSGPPLGPPPTPPPTPRERRGPVIAIVVIGALLGALLLIVSQFTALYHLHSATSSAPIKTVITGSNHAYAPIPIALVAIAFAFAVYRDESRPALGGLAALGIVTLLIALLGDLPDAHGSGLIGSATSSYVQATSSPSIGLYMETLGAIVLLLSGGLGFLSVAGRRDR